MASTGGLIILDVATGDPNLEWDRSILEGMEHPVAVCHGPEMKHLCPLLAGLGCDMFENAHGVVFKLDLQRSQHRAILRLYRELRPEVTVCAVVSPEQAERFAALLEDVQTWTHEPTVADLDGFAAQVEALDRP